MSNSPLYGPDELTPDERIQAVAAILARGILRLRKTHRSLSICKLENLPDSDANRLEVSSASRLTVNRRS